MASVTFSGQLDQAMNEAAAEGNKILFIPQQTVGEVLPGAASELVVESDGTYSITLAYNTYSIYHYSDVTKRRTLLANDIVVSADTVVSTIPDLIGSTVPVTEDGVLTIQGYLTEAQDSATAAAASEAAVTNRVAAYEVETTEYLINTFDGSALEAGDVVRTLGYYTAGDGGGAEWVKTGDTGTASQSCYDTLETAIYDSVGVKFDLSYSDVINSPVLGFKSDSTTDDTDLLVVLFESDCSVINILKGDYFIAGKGDDTGGVFATIAGSKVVNCSKEAVFFTDSLDNQMINITCSDGESITWTGGYFDQTNQKTSTVVPFITEYPSTNQGTSAVTDALYFVGNSAESINVKGVTFYAGEHWMSSGGDSGLLISDADKITVTECNFIGNRDLGIYLSGNSTVSTTSICVVDNTFKNCFGGVGIKRQVKGGNISQNTFNNCVRAINLERAAGTDSNTLISIHSNDINNYSVGLNINYSDLLSIHSNMFKDACAFEDDDSTVVDVDGVGVIRLEGVSNSSIFGNTASGVSDDSYSFYYIDASDYDDGTVSSTFSSNIINNNVSDSLYGFCSFNGVNNSFIYNANYNTTRWKTTGSLTDNIEIAIDTTTNKALFVTELSVSDGEFGAPSIGRRNQPNVGVSFNTNNCKLYGGSESTAISVTNSGMSFFGVTEVSKQSVSGSTDGNAALESLISALSAYGLITDSTT